MKMKSKKGQRWKYKYGNLEFITELICDLRPNATFVGRFEDSF